MAALHTNPMARPTANVRDVEEGRGVVSIVLCWEWLSRPKACDNNCRPVMSRTAVSAGSRWCRWRPKTLISSRRLTGVNENMLHPSKKRRTRDEP